MASPDLVKGLANEFLAPLKIGTTLEMLEERLKYAMSNNDVVRTLAISQLITATQKVAAKIGPPK